MFFNSLNAELNPICKSPLTGLLCGVLKFCACFLKNLNILRTKWDKFVKQKAFCGEGNSHCSKRLKNAVISLLHNREAKFLITICKYPCGRSFNCLHGGRTKRCLISYFLCGNIQNNFGPHKALCHTWHIWTLLRITPLAEHVTLPFHGIPARPVITVTCVQSSDVSIWFWDSRRACFTCETSRCIEENCCAPTGVEQQNLNWEKS
jgi:hypothetical protein